MKTTQYLKEAIDKFNTMYYSHYNKPKYKKFIISYGNLILNILNKHNIDNKWLYKSDIQIKLIKLKHNR